jgi:phosphoribosylformylglycinamidine synthase
MKCYEADIKVSLQEGITDPEGNATFGSLRDLGFDIKYARKSSVFTIGGIEAESKEKAEAKAEEMCRKLLANPVKDEYQIKVKEM